MLTSTPSSRHHLPGIDERTRTRTGGGSAGAAGSRSRRRRLLAFVAVAAWRSCGGDRGRRRRRRRAERAQSRRRDGRPRRVRAGARPSTRLPLTRQVGQLVVLRFARHRRCPATCASVLRKGRAAGAILFRDNLTGPDQCAALTAAAARGRAAGATPLICVDQEGGDDPQPAVGAARALRSPRRRGGHVGADAEAAARALRAAGINVSLAPVADVPSVAGRRARRRARSRPTPRRAARRDRRLGAAAGAPAASRRRPSTSPGSAARPSTPTSGSATVARRARPADADLAPFKAAIAAGVPLVMARTPSTRRSTASRIASQSPAVLQDAAARASSASSGVVDHRLDRGRRRPRVTGATEQAAVRSIRAGVDIVLTTGRGS